MDAGITVIGAGVVGLAVAAEVSGFCPDVFVIERNLKPGQETSSRNSGVIHSGIYYPSGSLKAELCVEGRRLLYEYCKQNEIPHRKYGKLIIATDEFEKAQLPGILERAEKNGVEGARLIGQDEIRNREANISAIQAIYFPETGIVDVFYLMKQLEADASNRGTNFVYGSEVRKIEKLSGGYRITLHDADGKEFMFTSEKVVNSAGLYADKIAVMAGINNESYRLFYWKGEYFGVINGKNKLINGLIYPVPESNTVSLGIHATLETDGRMKLGPNAIYLESRDIDYSVDERNKMNFYESVVRFLPFIEPEDLVPDQAGIRPKLQKPGDATRDFIIREETETGFPGFINLIGIESPGLTSCLAIGKYVRALLS
ncbi:MAG: NAD(P)/FAD-dependent oxidoreductase [Bacteroidota bacterium]